MAILDPGFKPMKWDLPGFQLEGTVWVNGQPVCGIHPKNHEVPAGLLAPGGAIDAYLEVVSMPDLLDLADRRRMGDPSMAGDEPIYAFARADLALRDPTLAGLVADIEVLLDHLSHASHLPGEKARRLNVIFDAVSQLGSGGAPDAVESAEDSLRSLLEETQRSSRHTVVGVGHSHLDTAWLWPMQETRRKALRTFLNALNTIDRKDGFVFACSQALHYWWIEQDHAEVFARIRAAVHAGRWEPVGGMWVEPDAVMPSGESVIRQAVEGQRYFESRFGIRCREAWLPDTFGFPASLPQILLGAGMDRFFSQKLSWNTTTFPHSSFIWRGLDGSEVLAHFPPAETYSAWLYPYDLAKADTSFKDSNWSRQSLLPFGYGDGGGGPSPEIIGRADRIKSLDGLPSFRLGTVGEFFDELASEAAAARPPIWDGELYFETHRGTLTSQRRTKAGNLACERLLYEAELWSANNPEHGKDTSEWWRRLLCHQFHDVLPGASIRWTHRDAESAHQELGAELDAVVGELLSQAAPLGLHVANATNHERAEVVVVADPLLDLAEAQELDGGRTAVAVGAGPLGLSPVTSVEIGSVSVESGSFDNGIVRIEWDDSGRISAITDLSVRRNVLRHDRHVHMAVAPDRPVFFDAWDLEPWTPQRAAPLDPPIHAEVVDAGPLVATFQSTTAHDASTIVQRWQLRAGSPRVELTLDIDWQQDEEYLSLLIPVDVHSHTATYGTQFGHVCRPTHSNNAVDARMFENCAHRFVDISEPSWGFGVITGATYGAHVADGILRLSLLRSARAPDQDADRGRHLIQLGLVPHGHGLGALRREADRMAHPLRIVEGLGGSSMQPLIQVSGAGVELSAVKLADDGSGDLIVRLYEANGDRTVARVECRHRTAGAWQTDLLEDRQHAVPVNPTTLRLRPFQIATLRFKLTTD